MAGKKRRSTKAPDPETLDLGREDSDPTDSQAADLPERKPVEIKFTEDDLKKLGAEFTDAIQTELSLRTNREQDWLRYTRLYNGQPKTAERNYPMQGAPLARDTEVLTRKGWRRVDTLSVGDVVLTRRDDDERLEWGSVEATPQVWAEKLYHFKNKTINQMVTPEHTMVLKDNFGVKKRLPARDAWRLTNLKVPLTGHWKGEAPPTLYGLSAGDVMELIGWYVAEGWCNKQNGRLVGSLFIGQSRTANPRRCQRLERLFDRLKIRWTYTHGVAKAYTLHARSMSAELAAMLRGLGARCYEKHLPDFVFDLDVSLLKRLYGGLILGDGNVTLRRGAARLTKVSYYTSSTQLAGEVQILCQLLGKRARIATRMRGVGGAVEDVLNGSPRTIVATVASCDVSVNSRRWGKLDRVERSVVEYNDYAFCVTVKNHAICVRRSGVSSWTGNSNVVVPLSRIYCDTLIAREMQAIFSISPHWMGTELNRKFAEAVKPMERWLDWAREYVWDQRKVVKSLVQETVKLGTSVLYNGWRDEQRFRYDDQKKQTVPAGRIYGPFPQWVALEDFIIPRGYSEVSEAPYVAHRLRFSWERLRQLAFSNYIENLDELKGATSEETELRRFRGDSQAGDFTQEDRFALYDLWSVWFQRDFDGDGWPEQHVMLLSLEKGSIHRIKPNPHPSQMRPFVTTRFIEQEGEFYGIGIPEMIEQLQEESSTIHNQRRDRAHLSNIVMWMAGAANHGLENTVRPASGKVLKVMDITQLKELRPSSNVTIDAYEEQFVNALADRTVGVSELNDGRMTSPVGRAAATTVMAMLQEGARRFDLYTAEMRAALSEQAHQIAELYQTYGLPDPEVTGSPEQVLDDKDAQKVRELLGMQDDLRNFMAIKLNVATQAVNREVEKKSNQELLQILTNHAMTVSQFATGVVNPQSPPQIREWFTKVIETLNRGMEKLLQSYGAFDLDSMIASDVLFQMSQPNPQQLQGPPDMGGNGQQPPALPAPGVPGAEQ